MNVNVDMNMINQAVEIALDFNCAEGISEAPQTLRNRAWNWYIHFDFNDPIELAAAVVSGDYQPESTWNDVRDMLFYFDLIY